MQQTLERFYVVDIAINTLIEQIENPSLKSETFPWKKTKHVSDSQHNRKK